MSNPNWNFDKLFQLIPHKYHRSFDQRRLKTALVFLILISTARWVPSGNEDNYLCLAKAWFDPDWMPNSWILNEPAGARVLYNLIVGGLLSVFNFYIVSIVLKILLSIAYAWILSEKVSPFVLGVVCYFPTFFGGEFIFMGCEPKHFAYLFILYHFFKRSNFVILLTFATWFHFLVGGWYALYWFMTNPREWKKCMLYALTVLPLIAYLFQTQMTTPNLNCDVDFVYARVRNFHHCYPLLYSYRDLIGFILAIVAAVFSKTNISRNIIIGSCIIAIVTSIYQLDSIVKFYPYRLLALALLIEIQFYYVFKVKGWAKKTFQIIGFTCIFYLLGTNLKDTWIYINDQKYQALIEYAKSLPKEVLIVSERTDFIRRSERDIYVNRKFVPNSPNRICEWYQRQENIKQQRDRFLFLP